MTLDEALSSIGRYGYVLEPRSTRFYGQVIATTPAGGYVLFRRSGRMVDRWFQSRHVTLHPLDPPTDEPGHAAPPA